MTLVLGDLAFISLHEFLAEHLREPVATLLGHDRVEVAIKVPVFAFVAQIEQLAAPQGFVEAFLQFVGIETVREIAERAVHRLEKRILVIQ